MTIGNEADLDGIRRVGQVVAETLLSMRRAVAPGITTHELDEIGAELMRSAGARSAPHLVYGFPGMNLISVNDEIVHGVPGSRRIEPGDIVKLDVTAELGGYIADAAETVVVPPASAIAARMQRCSVAAFHKGVTAARVGRPVEPLAQRFSERCMIVDSMFFGNCRGTEWAGRFTNLRRFRTTTRLSRCNV